MKTKRRACNSAATGAGTSSSFNRKINTRNNQRRHSMETSIEESKLSGCHYGRSSTNTRAKSTVKVESDPYSFSKMDEEEKIPVKRMKISEKNLKDATVNTCNIGTVIEPDLLGPCEPGTPIELRGIVWLETRTGLLVINVTWRGKTYVGTLLDSTKFDVSPNMLSTDHNGGGGPNGSLDSATIFSSESTHDSMFLSTSPARQPPSRPGRGKRKRAPLASAAAPSTTASSVGGTRRHSQRLSGPSWRKQQQQQEQTTSSLRAPRHTYSLFGSMSATASLSEESDYDCGLRRSSNNSGNNHCISSAAAPVVYDCVQPFCYKKFPDKTALEYHIQLSHSQIPPNSINHQPQNLDNEHEEEDNEENDDESDINTAIAYKILIDNETPSDPSHIPKIRTIGTKSDKVNGKILLSPHSEVSFYPRTAVLTAVSTTNPGVCHKTAVSFHPESTPMTEHKPELHPTKMSTNLPPVSPLPLSKCDIGQVKPEKVLNAAMNLKCDDSNTLMSVESAIIKTESEMNPVLKPTSTVFSSLPSLSLSASSSTVHTRIVTAPIATVPLDTGAISTAFPVVNTSASVKKSNSKSCPSKSVPTLPPPQLSFQMPPCHSANPKNKRPLVPLKVAISQVNPVTSSAPSPSLCPISRPVRASNISPVTPILPANSCKRPASTTSNSLVQLPSPLPISSSVVVTPSNCLKPIQPKPKLSVISTASPVVSVAVPIVSTSSQQPMSYVSSAPPSSMSSVCSSLSSSVTHQRQILPNPAPKSELSSTIIAAASNSTTTAIKRKRRKSEKKLKMLDNSSGSSGSSLFCNTGLTAKTIANCWSSIKPKLSGPEPLHQQQHQHQSHNHGSITSLAKLQPATSPSAHSDNSESADTPAPILEKEIDNDNHRLVICTDPDEIANTIMMIPASYTASVSGASAHSQISSVSPHSSAASNCLMYGGSSLGTSTSSMLGLLDEFKDNNKPPALMPAISSTEEDDDDDCCCRPSITISSSFHTESFQSHSSTNQNLFPVKNPLPPEVPIVDRKPVPSSTDCSKLPNSKSSSNITNNSNLRSQQKKPFLQYQSNGKYTVTNKPHVATATSASSQVQPESICKTNQ